MAITALAALLFGFLTLLFAYSVEDGVFEQELTRQGVLQQQHWRRTGALGEINSDYIEIYGSPSEFPADLAREFAENPRHPEFRGDGANHYQVRRLTLPGARDPVWLVAQVGDRQVVTGLRRKMLGFLGGVTLCILLLVGVLGWLLANRATAPLVRLERSLASQPPGQVPRIAATDYPANEIGRLAGALSGAFEQIDAFVARERSFTRDVSHELRTPLAVIRGGAELIQQEPGLPQSIRAPLQRIVEAERRMEETVGLLLALARGTAQGDRRERVQLAPLVEVAVLSASDRFGGRDRQVLVEIPADAHARLRLSGFVLILDNLISNAFQHAPEQRLKITLEGSSLVVASEVAARPAPSPPGAREPSGKTADSGRAGLGLTIVRRLCEHDDIPLALAVSEDGVVARLDLRMAA